MYFTKSQTAGVTIGDGSAEPSGASGVTIGDGSAEPSGEPDVSHF